MFNKLKGVFKGKKGFTIIEVVVVLAIMAVVATIVAPNFSQFGNKADTDKIKSELSTIHSVALNLAEEKETELYEYFEGSKTFELKKEIQSITNYNMDKIDGYKYGVAESKFIVYIDADEPYYWDGTSLTKVAPAGLHKIDNETYAKQVAAFIKTGGYIPDVTSKYFTFTNSKAVAPDDLEYGDTITGLTNLGREYFDERVIIPVKDDNGEKIVKIKENAFFGEGIKEVYIPKDVDVGNQAFAKNGDSKNSNSIDDTEVNKWYNGYEGEWKVLGAKWVKTVGIINIEPAGTDPFVTFTQNYQNLGLLRLHKATVITRTPNSNDPFTITSPAARPSRVVPSTFLENEAARNVTVKINEGKISSWSENTLYRGTQYDTRYVVGHLSPNYSGYIDGFKFTGTLPQDTVINGGTPANSKYVSGQTSSYYNEGGLNGYSGGLSQEYVRWGTPSGSKYVSSQTSSYYNDGEYSGSLSRYLYSGSPAANKYVSGQSSSWYNDGEYSGSISADTVRSGLPADSKSVTNQTSSSYDSGGYSGTLSSYNHPTTVEAQTKAATGRNHQNSRQTYTYVVNSERKWQTRTWRMDLVTVSGEYFRTGDGYSWVKLQNSTSVKTGTGYKDSYNSGGWSGTLTYQSGSKYGNAEVRNSNYSNKNLANGRRYDIATKEYYGTWGGYVYRSSGGSWVEGAVQWYAKDRFPSTISVSDAGYSGSIGKSGSPVYVGAGPTSLPSAPSNGSTGWKEWVWYQDYSGTITKPESTSYVTRYQGTVYRPDTRTYWYAGTVYRPDTATYRYQGSVSKGDTRVWAYHGTVSKGDTRVWDYTGTVTGDTREYKPYYFYQLILE